MLRVHVVKLRTVSVAAYRSVRDLTAREQKYLLTEILQVKGLMPLLMKPRNKQRWTAEDKAELRIHLRRLSSISPYLIVLALPGSFLMLPALAWWLDRRRNRKRPPESGVTNVVEPESQLQNRESSTPEAAERGQAAAFASTLVSSIDHSTNCKDSRFIPWRVAR